jgi:DNA-binding beta-propeller fold protein YncE
MLLPAFRGSRALVSLVSALALLSATVPIYAAPAQQVAPSAPDNLRCPGTPPPPSPGPGWQVVPVWEWRVVLDVEGVIGSNDGPYAVALDRSCNIYLTDSQHFQILKLGPDGSRLATWKLPGERAPGESSSPRGIAVDVRGNVYATDTPRDRIYKFSPQGQVVATWGACDTPSAANKYCDRSQPGMFLGPEGIAVDGTDNLFVVDGPTGRIQKLSTDGQPRASWELKGRGLGELFIPGSMSIDQGGFVYLAEAFNHQILKFQPNTGEVVGRWGGTESKEPGKFDLPTGVGVDAAGNLYVSDFDNWRVQKLAPDGAFLDQWRLCLDGNPPCEIPDGGQGVGEFMAQRGITLDGQGTVYVADTGNKRLQRLMIVDYVLIPPPPPEDEAE